MFYWKKINLVLLGLLFILMIPSIFPLVSKGFFVTDDGVWMIIRLSAFFDTLKDGQIPVRVLERLNNGYGYPVSNFLYPGFMYFGSLIHLVGFGFIDSIKIIFALSLLSSGLFTYFWLKKVFDPLAAFVGGLFSVYAPYHLYDVYTRGSVGEVLALSFLPFIFWQSERRSLPLVSVGIFLLIISHNSLAVLLLPLVVLYLVLRSGVVFMILSTVLGIILSSFFIIPALFELSYTKFNTISISNPAQYYADIHLIGISVIAVVVVLLFVCVFNFRSVIKAPSRVVLMVFLVSSILSVFLSLSLSDFFWQQSFSRFIQFPFRSLGILVVTTPLIAGFVVSRFSQKVSFVVAAILLVVLAYSATPYLTPQEKIDQADDFYSTNMDTTTVKDEYLPTWVSQKPTSMPPQKVEVVTGNATIVKSEVNSSKAVIEFANNDGTSVIRFNNTYYPGWKLYEGYEESEINYNNTYGAMDAAIIRGAGKLTFAFKETPLRMVANAITVGGIIIVGFLLLRPYLKFK